MLTSIWCAFLNVYFSTLEPSGMAPNKVFSEVRFIPRESLVDMLLLIACWMGSCQCQWQLLVGCQCRVRGTEPEGAFADSPIRFPAARSRTMRHLVDRGLPLFFGCHKNYAEIRTDAELLNCPQGKRLPLFQPRIPKINEL